MTEEEQKIESTTKDLISRITANEEVESTFAALLAEDEDEQRSQLQFEQNLLKDHFSPLNENQQTVAFKFYCEHLLKQQNSSKSQRYINHLQHLVSNNLVSPKPVCEALLSSSDLKYDDLETWCAVFKLVRRIIGGVHYKGCRDIFRVILEKCRLLPLSASAQSSQQVSAILEVVEYILDRNACLLPSYFAINEIMKSTQQDDRPQVHWVFGELFLEFTQSFRPTVQIATNASMSYLRPVIGHSNINAGVWRLDPRNLRFPINGPLPYDRDKPPSGLIRYILKHAHSVDFLAPSFKYSAGRKDGKHRSVELEEQLCDHIIHLMESQMKNKNHRCNSPFFMLKWQNVTSHMIFFVLLQVVSFAYMLQSLYKKVEGKNFHTSCARDHLMWLLLQFISGVSNRPSNNVYQYEFAMFLKLYDQLYPENNQQLTILDINNPHFIQSMAVSSVWLHMRRKSLTAAHADSRPKLPRPIPSSMREHTRFIEKSEIKGNPLTDYQLSALANAYSTSEAKLNTIHAKIMEFIQTPQQTMLSYNVACYMNTKPLPVTFLDSLSVHVKMFLIQQLFQQLSNAAKTPSPVALSPALVETACRLLIYPEMEQTYGIKAFVSTLIPSIFSHKSQQLMHTVLEMAALRRCHMQPHHRMTILSQILDDLSSVTHNQLYLRCESTAVKLLLSLGNVEVQQQIYRSINEKKFTIVSPDSETLNRILVLTLARALNAVSDSGQAGTWCKNVLKKIMEHTPHTWAKFTLERFPKVIQEFYEENPATGHTEEKAVLFRNVDIHFSKWKSCMNENEYMSVFTRQQGPDRPYFFCVMWKLVTSNMPIHHTAIKVLEFLGPKNLCIHMRVFADYLTGQLSACSRSNDFIRLTEYTLLMISKYNFFTLDRFLLCLCLRPFDQKESQVCLFAISSMLTGSQIKFPYFPECVNDYVTNVNPEYWMSSTYHEQHINFHKKHPEKFFYEGIRDTGNMPTSFSNNLMLPTYFDSICLRMLPVLDIIIHRLIETQQYGPTPEKALTSVLEKTTPLYKHHDQPITYLYNTLHFYHNTFLEINNGAEMKRKIVSHILSAACKPMLDAIVSPEFKSYMMGMSIWEPAADYYFKRVHRLVKIMSDEEPDPLLDIDWRFSEFTSAPAHVLYSTCVELLTIPVLVETIANSLIGVILEKSYAIEEDCLSWMNAVALILTALPKDYWHFIYSKLTKELQSSEYLNKMNNVHMKPFEVFNYMQNRNTHREQHSAVLLTFCHVIWYHSSIGQLGSLPEFIRQQAKPLVKTEQQFLFICHLIGPFLQRFQQERAACCVELTVELYEMLQNVDHAGSELTNMDVICDFFYHIKYMFVGDEPKDSIEKIIKTLRPALQVRLRFIAHHTTDGINITTPH